MNDADKPAALAAVKLYVRSGFYFADEIAQNVDESVLEPGTVDQDWLRAEIDKAFAQKHLEERDWPGETDCERLDRLFEALNADGIIARQNAGYTQSDGFSDVAQAYHEAGGEDSHITGYCFYHGQDLQRVIDSGNLCLAFGDVRGHDDKGTEIGVRIRKAAEMFGFSVEWDGTTKTRILLKGINWQRRSACCE